MYATRPTEGIRIDPPRTDLVAAIADSIGDAICGEAQSTGGRTRINWSAVNLEKCSSNFRSNVVTFGRSNRIRACSYKSPPRFVNDRIAQCGCEIDAHALRVSDVRAEETGRPSGQSGI